MFKPRRILVPVDLAPGAERGVRAAADLARATGGRLLLFHVFDSRTVEDVFNLHGLQEAEVRARMKATAGELMTRILGRAWMKGVRAEVRTAGGLPPDEIVKAAAEWKADLLVLVRRRRSGITHLLYGRTSDAVSREAPCAVLTLAP